ncbi:nuclear transport factor 2 family protein [Cloacibacterium sp.]|uniref:nuclear transport factor 2 family protein n=1 Tax=Cloacibacterium sp. TaxID=1913682 RepID=UPI0035B11A5F
MRNLLFLSLAFFVFSCKQNEEKVIISESNSANNEKVAKELFVHFNNHDWQKMADLYIENAEFKEPASGMVAQKKSKTQIVKEYTALQQQFGDVKDSVIAVYPSGDKNVIVEFVASGTLPDKTRFQLPICTIFTIENGKITKDYTYFDNSK